MSATVLFAIDDLRSATPQAAAAFVASELAKTPVRNAKFARFADIVGETYPDLSDHDPDGDNDDNIWVEGLDGAASNGDLKRLALKEHLADQALVLIVARAVVAAGLQLYDPNGQLLYRGDRKAVDAAGREHPF